MFDEGFLTASDCLFCETGIYNEGVIEYENENSYTGVIRTSKSQYTGNNNFMNIEKLKKEGKLMRIFPQKSRRTLPFRISIILQGYHFTTE